MTFTTEKALRDYLASSDAILNRYLAATFPPGDVEAAENVFVTRDHAMLWLKSLPENSFCFAASIVRTQDGKPLYSDPNDYADNCPEFDTTALTGGFTFSPPFDARQVEPLYIWPENDGA